MNELRFTWDEYTVLIDELIKKIEVQFVPNQIVGIATGGLIPAMAIAKYFKAPLAILSAESYKVGDTGVLNQKSEVVFAKDLAKTRSGFGGNVLVVDDLTDSGDTFKKSMVWLQEHYGSSITELKSAVLWHKVKSIYRPDFFVQEVFPLVDGNYPWIIQPIEKYERI